eukprot:4211924-Prymnesium_polylepis.2
MDDATMRQTVSELYGQRVSVKERAAVNAYTEPKPAPPIAPTPATKRMTLECLGINAASSNAAPISAAPTG